MISIADISEVQGSRAHGNPISWSDVSRSGIAAVILKATEGNGYVDHAFVENSIGAIAFDLLLGWYHFAHPDAVRASDPKDEADFFVATVKSQGFVSGKHLLALDIEEARHVHAGPEFVSWVLDFCDEVERLTDCRCAIYTGGPFFDSESGALDASTVARLQHHPLWLAAYVTDASKFVPKVWRDCGYVLHQDTGDVAPPGKIVLHVAGIGGGRVNVDHDEYAGTIDDLRAFVASTKNQHDPVAVPDGSSAHGLALDRVRDVDDAADALPDTQPDGAAARSQSSQKIAAVDAPIKG